MNPQTQTLPKSPPLLHDIAPPQSPPAVPAASVLPPAFKTELISNIPVKAPGVPATNPITTVVNPKLAKENDKNLDQILKAVNEKVKDPVEPQTSKQATVQRPAPKKNPHAPRTGLVVPIALAVIVATSLLVVAFVVVGRSQT